jgi:hypothetical protein
MTITIKTPAEIAAIFGGDVERTRATLRFNASQMAGFAQRAAAAKTQVFRGLTAEQWNEKAFTTAIQATL